jgi:hypothetical protein
MMVVVAFVEQADDCTQNEDCSPGRIKCPHVFHRFAGEEKDGLTENAENHSYDTKRLKTVHAVHTCTRYA